MIKRYVVVLIFFFGDQFYAQENRLVSSDSLVNKSYDYLFDRIELTQNHKNQQVFYLQYFLKKAKRESNFEEIVNGYKNYLHYSPDSLKIVYADSMIQTAVVSHDNALIGSSYLSKGIVYYGLKRHKKALDNYLAADNFISKTNDKYLIYKVKYHIASIKYFLGFYDEAISLFIECIDYFKEEDTRAYLNSLHLLGLCHNKIGNYGFCSEINKKGIDEGIRLSNNEMQNYFIHSEGINQYFKNNYAEAIKKISYSIPSIKKNKDFGNESVGYFYIGKSYWNLQKPEMALPYFIKVDEIFDAREYIRPDLRQNYELLLRYYKSKKDLQKQLYYTDKLLKADSVLDNKFIYLSGRVRKVYDTKLLLADKERIERLFNKRKYNDLIFTGIIVVMFMVLLFFAYRHFKIKSIYKLRYEEYMQNNQVSSKDAVNIVPKGIEEISEEKVAEILIKLEKFEHDKKYLEKDLNSIKLAAAFGCNPKYLSKVIYHYRGKKFVKYISDLKIDHLITLMKEDKKIRKYNNTALADEVGFSTTQKFSQAFYAKTGFPTSYFVEEINKTSE